MAIITDLACELLRRAPRHNDGIAVTTARYADITVHRTVISTRAAARLVGKPLGTYLNLENPARQTRKMVQALHQALRPLIVDPSKILIVGLGNDKFVADSLGPCVLSKIRTGTRLLTFEPCVYGVTGINSVDAIHAITKQIRPTAVIVIDSLVSATPSRIGTNYQICTSGITPGSGIGRDNRTIDQKLLGVPVLAIGVPVCTIMTQPDNQIYHVVPKDIDVVIRDCARIIAGALNILARRN